MKKRSVCLKASGLVVMGALLIINVAAAQTLPSPTPTPPPIVPTAPSGLTATALLSSQIRITWIDTSSNETGFKIERKAPNQPAFSYWTTVIANTTTYTNTGLTASTSYAYRVYAFSSTGNSAYSNEASAATLPITPNPSPTPTPTPPTVPAAPTNLTATPASYSQVTLTWTDSSANELGFKIERSISANGPFAYIGYAGPNVATFISAGLLANTTYYYRVYAYNAVGNSGYSNTASATTPRNPNVPLAPSGLSFTAASSTRDTLTWVDNSSNESYFMIERSISMAGPFVYIGSIGSNSTTYTCTALTTPAGYFYRVRAYNSYGYSEYSNVATSSR